LELWNVELPEKGSVNEIAMPAGHNVIVFVR
jgi:hypothetical protein